MPFDTYATLPLLFGKLPTRLGTISVLLFVIVETPVVMLNGWPEVRLKMAPNCQLSANRINQPGPLFRNARLGPNGKSHVPLLVIACVRWKPSSALLACQL